MFWKFLKKSPEQAAPAKVIPTASKTPVPLAFLQKLIPLGELPQAELLALDIGISEFKPGEIIFNLGDQSDTVNYLYSGEVFMETINGSGYSVDATTFKACYPLSTDTQHRFNAIAKLPSQVVSLPLSILKKSSHAASHNPQLNLKAVPAELNNSLLFDGFCVAFKKDQLQVPSLPDVAIRLRQALQKDVNVAEATKIINLDPVIASKLIQVVNSPLHRAVNPISNSHDAITRLGFKTTQNLVTSISLHNLFRSRSKRLNDRIQHLWRQSIQIASLSYTLASFTRKINADEALLAGLIHNIGALPIITYAETVNSELFSDQELDKTIATLQSLVGEYILKKWHFPESLLKIPQQTGNWYLDEAADLQLSDIVLLARFHSLLGSPQAQQLPPLNTLPAFQKLGDNALTPSMSLQALHDAKQQIAEALSFFRT